MRVIVVHTLDQAKIALSVAQELNLPVTLQSAPEAILYAGELYLKSLFDAAQQAYPRAKARFILDSGDAGAEAISALQIGHRLLRSSAHKEVRAKLASIAAQYGAELLEEPYEALDLQTVRDTTAACKKWLTEKAL